MIEISEASVNDINAIRKIAYDTWPKVYGAINSSAQIDYMLDLFYSESALGESIVKNGNSFLLVKDNRRISAEMAQIRRVFIIKNKFNCFLYLNIRSFL